MYFHCLSFLNTETTQVVEIRLLEDKDTFVYKRIQTPD